VVWKIKFYEDERKQTPTKDFIRNLSVHDRAHIGKLLRKIEEHGTDIKSNSPHWFDGYPIFQVRLRDFRIMMYKTGKKQELTVVNIFQKKCQKTPKNEITKAMNAISQPEGK
jgi:phage-related protein